MDVPAKGDTVRHVAGKTKLIVVGVGSQFVLCALMGGSEPVGRNRVPEVPPPWYQVQSPGHTFDAAYPHDHLEIIKKAET